MNARTLTAGTRRFGVARIWLACGAAWACAQTGCVGPVDADAARSARVVMSASDLFAQVAGQGGVVSVVDHAELTVTSGSGQPRTQTLPLSPAQPEATFDVEVPDGPATFEARVVSNNGTVLYTGSQSLDVSEDFTVAIDLSARAPVLLVTPDSLDVLQVVGADSTLLPFVVENRGSGVLTWKVADVSPALGSCGQTQCIAFVPSADTVPAGGTSNFLVVPVNTPQQVYRVTLTSPQGDVELKASLPAFVFPGLLGAHVVTNFGAPVANWRITYTPCTAESTEGDPGKCVPDRTRSPFSIRTDSSGVAQSFVASGFWRLDADPGQLGVTPAGATRFVGPAASVTVEFVMTVVGAGR